MSLWKSWYQFAELTKNKPPRKLLVKALPFVKERNLALDLGAGALNDSTYLLDEKFEHVIAVDKEPVALDISKNLPPDRFTYEISGLESYNFDKEAADLITAQYTLPFISTNSFEQVWENIAECLKEEGVFTGQLFGDRDEWFGNESMTFHNRGEAQRLLGYFEILDLEEEEQDKPTAAGIMKHWHVFHFILRKK